MKKSIILLLLPMVIACTKNSGQSKYTGVWTGSYGSTNIAANPSIFDSGTLRITVYADNKAMAAVQSLGSSAANTLTGTVDPSTGNISLSKYVQGNGGLSLFVEGLNGNLSLNAASSGSLAFPWATRSKWQATKN